MTDVTYIDLVDYVAIAAEVTGLDVETVSQLPNLTLAESALHASAAGFGDHELYPSFVEKAAVLLGRLARNHPLPDGNKRAAWVSLRLFVNLNEWVWDPVPLIDDAEAAVIGVASGSWNHEETVRWLGKFLKRAQEVSQGNLS